MKILCKSMAFLLCLLLLFTFSSCSEKQILLNDGQYLLRNAQSVNVIVPTVSLEPDTIYSSLEYTPEMFLGTYILPGGSEGIAQYVTDSDYFDFPNELYSKLTVLPYGIHSERQETDDGFHWMNLSFKSDTGSSVNKECAFTIEGSKLTVRILLNKYYDSDTNQIIYEFFDSPLEYTFSFSGVYLTLSSGEKSVTLKSAMFSKDTPDFFLSADIAEDSKVPVGIRHIEFSWSSASKSRLVLSSEQNDKIQNASALISEDGLFTLTVPGEEKNDTYQFVFFYAAEDALILTAGSSVYYFTEPYVISPDVTTEESTASAETSSDETTSAETTSGTDPVDPITPEDPTEKAEALASALISAFEKAGINVSIDEETGELNMDSALLFGGNSSDIYDNGMAFLNNVISIYSSVVFSDEFSGMVSKIYIEGHCAPVDGLTYNDCLPLSQKRAETVLNYCISGIPKLDPKYSEALKDTLEAIGMSNTKPVYDDHGNVDMDASRRVTFRFVICQE